MYILSFSDISWKTIYQLSESCDLTVLHDLSVTISNRKASVTFPACRWRLLTKYVVQIQEGVDKLLKKEHIKYFKHMGGGFYISVTTGFKCVDIRRFRRAKNEQLLPTIDGLSLRLCEWNTLFSHVSKKIVSDYPAMDYVVLCADQLDHCNQLGFLGCSECNPYSFFELYWLSYFIQILPIHIIPTGLFTMWGCRIGSLASSVTASWNTRRGPGIHLAVDIHRFWRRVNDIDSKFEHIFSDKHRFNRVILIELNVLCNKLLCTINSPSI